MTSIFHALAHETRRRIMDVLKLRPGTAVQLQAAGAPAAPKPGVYGKDSGKDSGKDGGKAGDKAAPPASGAPADTKKAG